jgi:Flp pilus assembly protein TadG
MKRRPLKFHDRAGATTVEFAFMVPIIFAIFMGAIEITRLNFVRQTVSNAAYEGARKAVMPGATEAEAENEATRILNMMRINNGATCDLVAGVDKVTMTVSVPISQNSWGITKFCAGMNVRQTVSLSRESFSNN